MIKSVKYLLWVRAGGQPAFFCTVSSDDVVVPVLVFLHGGMQLVVAVLADAYGDVLPVIDVMQGDLWFF